MWYEFLVPVLFGGNLSYGAAEQDQALSFAEYWAFYTSKPNVSLTDAEPMREVEMEWLVIGITRLIQLHALTRFPSRLSKVYPSVTVWILPSFYLLCKNTTTLFPESVPRALFKGLFQHCASNDAKLREEVKRLYLFISSRSYSSTYAVVLREMSKHAGPCGEDITQRELPRVTICYCTCYYTNENL